RSQYADLENKDAKKDLTDYMHVQYLTDSLDKKERSDPDNISKQLTLTRESNSAKRGATDLDSAVVAIRFDTLFNRLPQDLRQHQAEEATDSSTAKAKPKKVRTADFDIGTASVTEWQYAITPPMGFLSKPLPSDAQIALGPASLTERFSADKDGVVHADIRFDTAKRRFSVSEANEMRDKIADLTAGEPIL